MPSWEELKTETAKARQNAIDKFREEMDLQMAKSRAAMDRGLRGIIKQADIINKKEIELLDKSQGVIEPATARQQIEDAWKQFVQPYTDEKMSVRLRVSHLETTTSITVSLEQPMAVSNGPSSEAQQEHHSRQNSEEDEDEDEDEGAAEELDEQTTSSTEISNRGSKRHRDENWTPAQGTRKRRAMGLEKRPQQLRPKHTEETRQSNNASSLIVKLKIPENSPFSAKKSASNNSATRSARHHRFPVPDDDDEDSDYDEDSGYGEDSDSDEDNDDGDDSNSNVDEAPTQPARQTRKSARIRKYPALERWKETEARVTRDKD